MKQLLTDRLLLRPMQMEDAPDFFSFWSDPTVTKYMNIEAFTDIKQAEQMILLLQELGKENKASRWTITLKDTDDVIGSCGFNTLDFENERAEIGYDLGYRYWGKGFAPEALRALILFGFNSLHLNRIEAKVEPDNLNSIKVLKKLGFSEEGLLRQYEKSKGKLVDIIILSTLRNEWTGEFFVTSDRINQN